MSNKLIDCFKSSKYYSLKYKNYFDVYQNIFSNFKNKKITFVEIGVFSGGSLFMWRKFFGKRARIIGIDLNPEAKKFEKFGFEIFVGNQSSSEFWKVFFKKVGKVDIIIDDGGHTNYQQIITTISCVPNIKDNGILVIEDVFHSYLKRKYFNPSKFSFLNFGKKLIDDINFRFPNFSQFKFSLNQYIYSIEFFESLVCFKINRKLSKKNEVIKNKGTDISVRDMAHAQDNSVPGSNYFIVRLKNFFKFFKGNLTFLVFLLNSFSLRKYFK
jgi:hypothetical protein